MWRKATAQKWRKLLALLAFLALVTAVCPWPAARADGGAPLPVQVAAGERHSLAIRFDGALLAWGGNDHGQLGNGMTSPVARPVKVMEDVSQVAAGAFHTLAIKMDNTLWAWGENAYGQLGTGRSGGLASVFDEGVDAKIPRKILDQAAQVTAGSTYTLALRQDATLWFWGELGGARSTTPVQVTGRTRAMAAGGSGFLTVDTDGNLYEWSPPPPPMSRTGNKIASDNKIELFTSSSKLMENVVAVAAGKSHNLAVSNDGVLYAWGGNEWGQLGDGTTNSAVRPVKVLDQVRAAMAGSGYSAAVTYGGALYTWGHNSFLVLGLSGTADVRTPTYVMPGVQTVAAGPAHAMALCTNGALYAWGRNQSGQLGNGRTDNALPEKVLDGLWVHPSAWAVDEVSRARSLGLVPTRLLCDFDREISREEFCALTVRMLEKKLGTLPVGNNVDFSDTSDVPVLKLATLGAVDGVGNGKFDPAGLITREQAARILAFVGQSALKLPNGHRAPVVFADAQSIAAWAADAVDYVSAQGIMNGKGDRFAPKDNFTREEAILTVLRLYR